MDGPAAFLAPTWKSRDQTSALCNSVSHHWLSVRLAGMSCKNMKMLLEKDVPAQEEAWAGGLPTGV